MALACRQCRTRGSLRACCDKLTCTARSGRPLDCTTTLPKTPDFCCRCLVFWLGSCSNIHFVDLQCISTLRHIDLFGENWKMWLPKISNDRLCHSHPTTDHPHANTVSLPKPLDSRSKSMKTHSSKAEDTSNRCSEGN